MPCYIFGLRISLCLFLWYLVDLLQDVYNVSPMEHRFELDCKLKNHLQKLRLVLDLLCVTEAFAYSFFQRFFLSVCPVIFRCAPSLGLSPSDLRHPPPVLLIALFTLSWLSCLFLLFQDPFQVLITHSTSQTYLFWRPVIGFCQNSAFLMDAFFAAITDEIVIWRIIYTSCAWSWIC